MFDKLVESDLNDADLKPRRRIFVASFVFVGLLFATAVVAGIYAADYTLGTDNFDIVEMLAPVAATEPVDEPEPDRAQTRTAQSSLASQTTRQTNMARVDEPTIAPSGVSVERNRYLSRPIGRFLIGNEPETNAAPAYESNRPGPGGNSSLTDTQIDSDADPKAAPPPPAPPKAEKRKTPVSGGVMTGKAISLPTPVYSAAARAVGAKGAVTVQITVDEEGKVISAKALDGNPMLRVAAVEAAWKAKFKPTTLTGVPVKVTGLITYHFNR